METCFINSPLGITKIVGDDNGISVISILEEGIISAVIPSVLQEAVLQLQDYFRNERTEFTFKTNAKGTDF